MQLSEILRADTFGLLDSVAECRKALQTLQQEKNSKIQQTGGITEEITGCSEKRSRAAEELESLNARISLLSAELANLQRELDQKEEERSSAESEGSEWERKWREAQNSIKEATREIKKREEELERFDNALTQARREAFWKYLRELEGSLVEGAKGVEETMALRNARTAFEEACAKDPSVKAQREQREELSFLVDFAQNDAVKAALRAQLNEVERTISGRFPRALETETVAAVSGQKEMDVFFCRPSTAGKYVLFLPVSKAAWNSVEEGQLGAREDVSARALWHIMAALGITAHNSRFYWGERFLGVQTEIDLEAFKKPIEAQIGTISYTLSIHRLPLEVEVALRDKCSDL